MNASSSSNPPVTNSPRKPRKLISIPFMIVALALGVGGYYSGPTIMTYYFLLEGQGQLPWSPSLPNYSLERSLSIVDGNSGEASGGEEQSQDRGARTARRPPGEFDEPAKSDEEVPAAPKP